MHDDSDAEIDVVNAEQSYLVANPTVQQKTVKHTRRKKQYKCKYQNYGKTKFFRSLEVDDSKKSNSNKGVRTTKQSTGIVELCMIYYAFENMTVNDHLPDNVLQKIHDDPSIKWEL